MAMTKTDEARVFVERHLGGIIAEFPAPVRETLLDKFLQFYTEPLTPQLELVLRKRLTDDEVRFLLFAPTPAQYGFYAALLSVWSTAGDVHEDDELSTEPWIGEIRKRFLTLFYFKHASNWPLVVQFILQDGLQILVDLFMHRDLQVRGQAIDSFVQITSNHVAFEWFEPPVGYEARLLHAKMVALASPQARFLRQIVANIRLYEQPLTGSDSQRLPGGTFVLLQVLAFFLSWVRKLYTQNELRLSRELLTLLGEWKQRTQSDNEDELQLAQQVYEDFSRWPAIEDADSEASSGSSTHIGAVEGAIENDLFSEQRVLELLSKAVETGDDDCVEQAIAVCSEAIAANVNVVTALVCRAKAHACRAGLSPTNASDAIRLCLVDCSSVWEREPGNMDVWRVQLELFATHKMWTEACEALDAWYETQTESYLQEDAAFLMERRVFFDEKAHEQRQQQREQQSKHEATRQAKEKQIYELLLQRSGGVDSKSTAETFLPSNTTPPATESTHVAVDPPQRDILARFRSSSTKSSKPKAKSQHQTDAPVASVVQTRAFVRKFVKCHGDLAAIRSLLSSSSFHDVASALDSSLPDACLVLALEALVASDASHDNATLARVLQHLLSLPRLALLLEMASAEDQQKITNDLHKARALLDSFSSNALAA